MPNFVVFFSLFFSVSISVSVKITIVLDCNCIGVCLRSGGPRLQLCSSRNLKRKQQIQNIVIFNVSVYKVS